MHLPELVLYQPDIPGNTGTILRLCACLGFTLRVIEPAGFRFDDKSLRRAGMDYVELAQLRRHENWDAFCEWQAREQRRLVLFTTKAEMAYTEFEFASGDCLLFGRESGGVPGEVADHCDHRLTIPMRGDARSLNLAVSVAMVAGEAMRQSG